MKEVAMRESLSKISKTKGQVKAIVKSGGTKSASKTAVKTKPVKDAKKTVSASRGKQVKTAKKEKVTKTAKPVRMTKAKPPVKTLRPAVKAAKSAKGVKTAKPVKVVKVVKSARKASRPKAAIATKPVKVARPAKQVARKAPVKVTKKAAVKPVQSKSAKKSVVKAPSPVRAVAPVVQTKKRKKLVLPLVITPAPLPPEPPRRQMSTAGLKAFEQAVKMFNRRQYPEAKTHFENLAVKFPQEVEIIARAQTYIHVCAQKMAHSQALPRNADELYDRGVFALNIGDFTQARSFFEKALRLRPDEPYLLYSLAATHAQTGAYEQALDYLKRSIQMQPRFRAQALHDNDFSGLRDNKRFLELLGLASPFDMLEARR